MLCRLADGHTDRARLLVGSTVRRRRRPLLLGLLSSLLALHIDYSNEYYWLLADGHTDRARLLVDSTVRRRRRPLLLGLLSSLLALHIDYSNEYY
ncbi:hypothetical protein J6590_006907 [Homalodisca vitripennis]|nr:hypothetical protein J6590_006907 [Homalodisca vitripennis]